MGMMGATLAARPARAAHGMPLAPRARRGRARERRVAARADEGGRDRAAGGDRAATGDDEGAALIECADELGAGASTTGSGDAASESASSNDEPVALPAAGPAAAKGGALRAAFATVVLLVCAGASAAYAGVLPTLDHLPGWRELVPFLESQLHKELQQLYMPALSAAARLGALVVVRLAAEPVARFLYTTIFGSGADSQWENSFERRLVVAAKGPAEVVLLVSAVCALLEHVVGPLLALPPSSVRLLTNRVTSLALVLALGRVLFAWKDQRRTEAEWQAEISGEADPAIGSVDKLLSALIVAITAVVSLQSLGFDVNSLLALGGIGGLVLGLAGRDISENLLSGLMVLTTKPFAVGDIVRFYGPNRREVHGVVLDIGWYRSTIRSFDFEVFVVPNSVFTSAVLLNISRRGRTFRYNDMFWLAPEDVLKVDTVVRDFRAYLRNAEFVIQGGPGMHRRVFLYEIKPEACLVYVSCYVEAANRDAYLNSREALILQFARCMERAGVRFAAPRRVGLAGDPFAVDPGFNHDRAQSIAQANANSTANRASIEQAGGVEPQPGGARGGGAGAVLAAGAAVLAATDQLGPNTE
eukprot:PRCOL_00003228-RA